LISLKLEFDLNLSICSKGSSLVYSGVGGGVGVQITKTQILYIPLHSHPPGDTSISNTGGRYRQVVPSIVVKEKIMMFCNTQLDSTSHYMLAAYSRWRLKKVPRVLKIHIRFIWTCCFEMTSQQDKFISPLLPYYEAIYMYGRKSCNLSPHSIHQNVPLWPALP
jgi:hypothetical protein